MVTLSWQALLPAVANSELTDDSWSQHLGAHVLTGNQDEEHRHGKTEHMGTKHCLSSLLSIELSLQPACIALISVDNSENALKLFIKQDLQSVSLQKDPPIPRL
jgi:hypothetical protein